MTYTSPYIRIDQLKASVHHLEQQVETLKAEKETLLEDNVAHLKRHAKQLEESRVVQAHIGKVLFSFYNIAQVFTTLNPEYGEDDALEALLRIQKIIMDCNDSLPNLPNQS